MRALAEFMFGSEDAMIRLDMSEFMERHAVSRLVGAPPGYVGYEEGGQLTEAVRRKSYCVILLDEIEKAHPDAYNILLQIFDDGHLTDAKGRRVDFRNSIVVMTSNIGAQDILKNINLGFVAHADDEKDRQAEYEKMKDKVLKQLKSHFRPEFLNRIDGKVVFHSLNKEQIRQIVELMLSQVVKSLTEKNMKLEITDAAKDFLGSKGYDPTYGARPLRRAIQDEVEDKLSEQLLRNEFPPGTTISIDYDGQKTVTRYFLTKEGWREIIINQTPLDDYLQDKNVIFEVTETAKDYLNEKAYDTVNGSNTLREVTRAEAESGFSEKLLNSGELPSGTVATVDYSNQKLVVRFSLNK